MAKRKTLKKNVNYICSELFAECVGLLRYNNNTPSSDVENIMTRILMMRREFVSRISHTEPGLTKPFYKKFREDFNAQVEDITVAILQLC